MPTWIVCGGRDYDDYASVERALFDCLKECFFNPTIVQGGASGADALARRWAAESSVPCITVPADWKRHGKAAGPKRNQRMLDEHAVDLVVAFPGGRGTADMVRRAKARGVRVLVVESPTSPCGQSPTPATD